MEMPAIASSTYSSTPLDLNQMFNQALGVGNVMDARNQAIAAAQAQNNVFGNQLNQLMAKKEPPMSATRLVQVFIADPNENIPLDQRLIYSGAQKLTDLTDQELFFEIDIRSLLSNHNAERVKLVNKAVKERTEHLEAARIRDLKMTVVTIAQF